MEEQGLVVVKDNFLSRLTNALKRFIFKGKMKDSLLEENTTDNIFIQEIIDNNEFVQKEILDARRAFRKYVINNTKNISTDILSYIEGKVKENQLEIRQLIRINNEDSSLYEDILKMIENEIKDVSKFKYKNTKTGRYNVPMGVIGIECENSIDSIKAIFKAISTRNSVIILHDKYNQYSTEALILLIIKECLKNFYIDDNIIQMFSKEEIDLSKLDNFIPKSYDAVNKENKKIDTIYIYQENNKYEKAVKNEIARLESIDEFKTYKIKPIKGDFGNIVNYLNTNNSSAVCMYTDNSQKAYKFINWINSPNVFVNTGIKSCKEINNISDYYNSKYVLHEDVF